MVSREPISFFGGVDPRTGMIVEEGHPLRGSSMKGKVLVVPGGKGSTVGSWTLYELSMNGAAPAAIVCRRVDPIIAVGAVVARIPMVVPVDVDPLEALRDGVLVEVEADGRLGYVVVVGG